MVWNLLDAEDRKIIYIGAFIFLISIASAFAVGGVLPDITGEATTEAITSPFTNGTLSDSGYANENTETSVDVPVSDGIVSGMQATISWEDEGDLWFGVRYTNMPDEFTVVIVAPWGEEVEQTASSGSVSAKITVNEDNVTEALKEGAAQKWTVIVRCGECGNNEPIGNIIGLREAMVGEDPGNDWSLEVTYDYAAFESQEEN